MEKFCLSQQYVPKSRLIDQKLFNQYTDPLGYFEICLAIFQAADFRQTSEISQCWEAIINKGNSHSSGIINN